MKAVPLAILLCVAIVVIYLADQKKDMHDLGGGFHTDTNLTDAYFAECSALTIKLEGEGGGVRTLQSDEVDAFLGIRVVVIGNETPTTTCKDGVFTIETMSSTDIVYIGSKEGFRFMTEN